MHCSRLLLTLFLITASVNAENMTEALHIFKHSSQDNIARQVTKISSCKLSQTQLLQLFDMLDDKSSLKKVGNHSEVRDLAVIIFQELSSIPPADRDLDIKAIISYKSGSGEVFRYRLLKLTDKERAAFKIKVQNWLLKKLPA